MTDSLQAKQDPDGSPARSIAVGDPWGGDDLWHRADAGDSAYRESYYFDFADEDGKLAGFTSVGWKPKRGVLGATTVVFDEAGAWMAQGRRDTSGDFPVVDVEGLAYDRSADAYGSWDLSFRGAMVPVPEIGTRARLAGAGEAGCSLGVGFRPTGPAVCTTGADYEGAFSWHLEQPGEVEGRFERDLAADPVTFRGRGHRDRSFGAREWTLFASWIYLAGHTRDVTVNLWALQRPAGDWVSTGWFRRGGGPVEVVERLRLEPTDLLAASAAGAEGDNSDPSEGGEPVPAVLEFELVGTTATIAGSAESCRLAPLGFTSRRGSSRLDRGIGEYVIDGEIGSGQVEYQQRIDPPGTSAGTRPPRWLVGAG